LGNSTSTCFHVKQSARSRHVLRTVFILPSVSWRNQQIKACLILRHKPRNHPTDFEAQITKA
jgi:hypothetical protein